MNEQKIIELSHKVIKLVEDEAQRTQYTMGEINAALGEAIGVLNYDFARGEVKGVQLQEKQPEDEDKEENENEEFEYQSGVERAYAFQRLSTRYPKEAVCLIGKELIDVPMWLQKEIIERRG